MIRAAETPNVSNGQSKSVDIESESSLIRQSKQGSHAAFAELIRRNHPVVRAVLGRYLRDDNELDEVAQRAFVAAYRSIDQFRGEATFGSWLVTIARRQAAMYCREESRRRQRETTAGERVLAAWTDASMDEQEDVDVKLATLAQCLRQLPAGSRDAITRYYFQQQSIDVIASALGRRRGAIRMLLMRVRGALAKCISQRLSEAEGKP